MSLVPHRFLFRMLYPGMYVKHMPLAEKGSLLDLPPEALAETMGGHASTWRKGHARRDVLWGVGSPRRVLLEYAGQHAERGWGRRRAGISSGVQTK